VIAGDAGTKRLRNAAVCLVLGLLTAYVYAGSAANGFINFDDPEYVSKNPVVQQGVTWRGIRWALGATEQANWHPLTWLSHMLDVSLFGMQPGPQHLVSALIHVAAVLLLFLALENLTGALWPSALIAALFGVHPVHVESVAWIAERKDVLCGFFWMLALLVYSRSVRKQGGGSSRGVAVWFTLALAAKPMAVTFPLILLVLDWWPLGRFHAPRTAFGTGASRLPRPVREKLPYLAISSVAGVAALALQWRGSAVKGVASHPSGLRVENTLVSAATYLLNLLWPHGLGVLYPFPAAPLPPWQWLAAGLVLAGLTLVSFRSRRRLPWVAAGWIWYVITLLPVSGLIQVGEQARADRYLYLPSIGLTIMAAWGSWASARRFKAAQVCVAVGSALAIAVLAVLARDQVGRWRTSETLFRHTLSVAGESLLRTNLGGALIELERWEDALREYDIALSTTPNDRVAWFNVGIASGKLRRWEEAMEAYRAVILGNPADAEARFNVGMIAVTLGDRDAAEEQLKALAGLDKRLADNLRQVMARREW
jgi:tetratricopeptide (TPR) repeat protein